jgi:tetratricopeptide (TPR) repeat protein
MRTVCVVVLAVCTVVGVASAQVAVPPYHTGALHLTEAAFARAIQPYQQAIQASAQNARAHYWLGFAYSHAHRHYWLGLAPYAGEYGKRAASSLEQAIKLAPNMIEAYSVLIETYHQLGEYEKANEMARQALAKGRPAGLPATQFPPARP